MRTPLAAFFIIAVALPGADLAAQGTGRYASEIFTSYQLQSNILYGQAVTSGGSTKALYLDIYSGTGDTATSRPLVIFIHGGGFKDGDKVSNFGTRVCGGLARRGYVVASINYRTSTTIANDTAHFEAMLRALQDGKASVRFFRRFAWQYGVDTSQIFVTGSSAGSITALHMAFLDSLEVPPWVDLSRVGGTFEGSSGTAGYASNVHGVISNWGAIGDTAWMAPKDLPVFCVHGTNDVTVYYDSIPADGPFLYGSKFVYEAAKNRGIRSGLRAFVNTGHTLDNSAAKQDSAIRDFSAWLATILRPAIPTSVGEKRTSIPATPVLRGNYPNPFNPTTTLEYEIPRAGHVTITVFDAKGEAVSTLRDEIQTAGTYRVHFDASGLATGAYFCRLTSAGTALTRRVLLVR